MLVMSLNGQTAIQNTAHDPKGVSMHCTTAFRPKVDGYVTERQVFWLA